MVLEFMKSWLFRLTAALLFCRTAVSSLFLAATNSKKEAILTSTKFCVERDFACGRKFWYQNLVSSVQTFTPGLTRVTFPLIFVFLLKRNQTKCFAQRRPKSFHLNRVSQKAASHHKGGSWPQQEVLAAALASRYGF